MNHLHTILQLSVVTEHRVGPQSESSQVGSDTRHLKGYCLKWGVPPGLVVRWIDAQVVAQHHIVVGHVHDTIITVQIARQENHLHVLILTVVHIVVFQHAQHVVVTHVMQPVCHHRHLKRRIKLNVSLGFAALLAKNV